MSREELVQAYANGALDRRAFIRRLAAAGVSVGAAASYAHLLAPKAEADEADAVIALDDAYPQLDLAIRSKTTERVANTGVVRVRVECTDKATVLLGVDVRHKGKRRLIGRKRVRFPRGGERVVRVPISQKGQNILNSREKAGLRVSGIAVDADPNDAGVFDRDRARKRLK